MLFNSWQFAVFFPVVTVLYFLLPHRFRWAWLLAGSYTFYMCAVPEYGVLLLGSTVVDYFLGRSIHQASGLKQRRFLLIISLCVNLGLLFLFKYYNLFALSAARLVEFSGGHLPLPVSRLILPVGISFYTFQTLSYSLDIYQRRLEPESHFGRYALYVSFFPQLVAGPIERAGHFLPQLKREVAFDYERVTSGLKLMAWGLCKKIVIADHLARFVTAVYGHPETLTGPHYALATVFFAFQIYCDFSGYSDVAIGAARVLGYDLMKNFDRPYAARSLGEFWRRWHISLSTWFRDYVYIPLGGSRGGARRTAANLMIVFLVSGLWHGARWNYVIWGALHGVFLISARPLEPFRSRLAALPGIRTFPQLRAAASVLTVFALVCFAWIFFRADSFSHAMQIVSALPEGWHHLTEAGWLKEARLELGFRKSYFTSAFAMIAVLEWLQWLATTECSVPVVRLWTHSSSLRWVGYVTLLLVIMNLGAPKAEPFIYFQF